MFVDSYGVVFPQGHKGDRVLSQKCTSTGEMEIFIRPEGQHGYFLQFFPMRFIQSSIRTVST